MPDSWIPSRTFLFPKFDFNLKIDFTLRLLQLDSNVDQSINFVDQMLSGKT